MADDAVLGYHTALEFHGKAHSAYRQFLFLTRQAPRPLTFRGDMFRGVAFPRALIRKRRESFGVTQSERAGMDLRVTSLERTLVDVLDRPVLGGGWEEIWRSLESVEYFDLDQVVEYALLLGNSTTIAKVGFFLDQHRDRLMVDPKYLQRLSKRRPRQPHYLVRGKRESGRLVPAWQLVVPPRILERSWEETV
jgi:predicted transcriptional regulator of viral defense system